MLDLTIAYKDRDGYNYVETSEWLKEAAEMLPCFAALEWPDYDSTVVEDTIDGKPVVIQLWKGWCQQFLSSPNFPGGIGAEVGIYERVTGKGFPSEKPDWIPDPLWIFLKAKSKLANGDFWWPVAERHEIEFDFINPINGTIAFHAGPQRTYWRNKRMDTDDYDDYEKTQGKKWKWLPSWWPGNTRTPVLAANYSLAYKINGKQYETW
jgi:hypothetical protein